MKIQSSSTELKNHHRLQYSEQKIDIQLKRPNANQQSNSGQNPISVKKPKHTAMPLQNHQHSKVKKNNKEAMNESFTIDIKTMLLKALVESFSGKKISLANFYSDITDNTANSTIENPTTEQFTQSNNQNNLFTYSGTLIKEYEISSTTIDVNIIDENNNSIDIHLSVTMERRYEFSFEQFTLQAQKAMKDPLVINYNQEGVQLSSNRFSFDIDNDGVYELLPLFQSNSAYIALDKNHDGIINNGSELFGAISGDGFSELAQYDEDNNGFIDNNDSVFSQLLSYQPSQPLGQAKSLNDLGIAALALQSIVTPFQLNDQHNQTLGQIRSTGYYLYNNGDAGSLQQIDLIV